MELEELKLAWQSVDGDVRDQQRLNRLLLGELSLRRVRSRMWGFLACRAVQALLAIALVVVIAPYWLAHRDQPALLASGLALHAYGVAAAVSAMFQLVVATRIQAGAPVLVAQRYVASLHAWRARSEPWLGFAWWLLWVPTVLVALDLAVALDLWAARPWLVLAWLGAGAAGLAMTLWLLHAAPACWRMPVRAWMARSSIGAGLLGTGALLDDIAAFERE